MLISVLRQENVVVCIKCCLYLSVYFGDIPRRNVGFFSFTKIKSAFFRLCKPILPLFTILCKLFSLPKQMKQFMLNPNQNSKNKSNILFFFFIHQLICRFSRRRKRKIKILSLQIVQKPNIKILGNIVKYYFNILKPIVKCDINYKIKGRNLMLIRGS